MRKYKFMVAGLLTLVLLTGCASATDITEKAGQAISDELQHQASKTDPNVQAVKNGTLGEYTNITVGEAFETFFGDPKWKYFNADTGEDVVEFTGYCTYQDVKVLARLQFIVSEETFEVGALSFNDVPQNELIKAGLLSKIYENQDGANTESVEGNQDVVDTDSVVDNQTTSENLDSNEAITIKADDQFTESILGFDVQEFIGMKFETDSRLQEFLSDHGFEIINGDIGAFHAVDDLETDLLISTSGNYESGWNIDFVEAEVSDYAINLGEVEAICDPNNEREMLYDEDTSRYYYSVEIDGVQVNYNFSMDSLREENPQALSITLIAVNKQGGNGNEIACECVDCWSTNAALYKEGSSIIFKCNDCNTSLSWDNMDEELVNQVFSSVEVVRFGGRAAGQCSQCGRGPAFAVKDDSGIAKDICLSCGSIFEY